MIPPILLLAQEQNRLWLAVTAYLTREILLHTIYPILTSVTMNVLAKENRSKEVVYLICFGEVDI